MSELIIQKLSLKSHFTLMGEKDKPQLAVDGALVTISDLKASGFSLSKSGEKGGKEICLRCSPDEKTRIWYEVSVFCNGVTGPVWICSNCSRVYVHKRRGMALWQELFKTLEPMSSKSHEKIEVKQFLPDMNDIENAFKVLSSTKELITFDDIYIFIEKEKTKEGIVLKNNWRMITEENFKIWDQRRGNGTRV